jgi:hypothetical protein
VVYKTCLQKVILVFIVRTNRQVQNKEATLGAQSYKAFSAMLCMHTSLKLKLASSAGDFW